MASLTARLAGSSETELQLWLPRPRTLLLRTPGRLVLAYALPDTLPAPSRRPSSVAPRRPLAHQVRLHPPVLDLDAFELVATTATAPTVPPPRVAPSPVAVMTALVPEPLSAREHELLRVLAGGDTNRELAVALGISAGTVRWHLSNIYGKLGVQRRTQAIARARSLGLLPDDDA